MLLLPATALAWNELRTDHVEASSFLRSNWNKYEENYHPYYAFDDDPRTAWVEGVEGTGEGQWLEWQVSPLASARAVKLTISNGYQKSDKLLAANAAPREIRVELRDAAGRVVGAVETTLERKMGAQEVVVPATGGFAAVRLVVKSVWPGATYKDTVVSDIRTWVDSDVPYRAALEAGKLTKVKAWIAERVATAKYFAALPPTYPYKGTSATSEPWVEQPPSICHTSFLPWQQTLVNLRKETAWYQVKLPAAQPTPDGLWGVPETGWLVAAGVTLFETAKDIASHEKKSETDIWWETWVGNVHVQWADAARTRPRFVYTWSRHAGEERGPYDYRSESVLSFDEAGRLAWTYEPGTQEGTGTATLRRFDWVDGKVAAVMELSGPITAADTDGYTCSVQTERL